MADLPPILDDPEVAAAGATVRAYPDISKAAPRDRAVLEGPYAKRYHEQLALAPIHRRPSHKAMSEQVWKYKMQRWLAARRLLRDMTHAGAKGAVDPSVLEHSRPIPSKTDFELWDPRMQHKDWMQATPDKQREALRQIWHLNYPHADRPNPILKPGAGGSNRHVYDSDELQQLLPGSRDEGLFDKFKASQSAPAVQTGGAIKKEGSAFALAALLYMNRQ